MIHTVQTSVAFVVLAAQVSGGGSGAAEPAWKQYAIAESGFTVALPLEPAKPLTLPSPDGSIRVYQATIATQEPTTFSVFVGQPQKRGIFEPASVDTYLTGHVQSMVTAVDNGKLHFSQRITFRGRPAVRYQIGHQVAGRPYVSRGITMMVDGGHIRVSVLHPAGDPLADARSVRFIDSFQLMPVSYQAVDKPFADPRGITFSPPAGWVQESPRNAAQAARFSNLTRSITLLVAGTAAYSCNTFQAEVKASGRLRSTATVRLDDQEFTKLTVFEDLPSYQVRLTTVQYCINSRSGAVVVTGTEEEAMFSRWAQVFEGAAASVRVR